MGPLYSCSQLPQEPFLCRTLLCFYLKSTLYIANVFSIRGESEIIKKMKKWKRTVNEEKKAQPRIYSRGELNATRGRGTASEIVHIFTIIDPLHLADQVLWLKCFVNWDAWTPHSMGSDQEFRPDVIHIFRFPSHGICFGKTKLWYPRTTFVSNILWKGRGDSHLHEAIFL